MSSYTDLREVLRFAPLQEPLRGVGARSSPFSAPWTATVGLLERELRMVGATAAVMEIDIAPANIRQDGMPRADRSARTPGIRLSFKAMSVPKQPSPRYEVADFAKWQDNVRAIALGLEALRAMDRYGMTKLGQQYQGFAQLESGMVGSGNVAHGQLLILAAGGWKRAAELAHPDKGGDPDDFRDVIAARDAGNLGS